MRFKLNNTAKNPRTNLTTQQMHIKSTVLTKKTINKLKSVSSSTPQTLVLSQSYLNLTTSMLLPTVYTTLQTNGILTDDEKEKQKKFTIIVATSFFTFLFLLFLYVTVHQWKKVKNIAKSQNEDEEESDAPKLKRRTSMVGQGQKQVVIERKSSNVTAPFRKSSGNSVLNSSNGSQKLQKLPSWQASVEMMKRQQSMTSSDRLLPPSHETIDEKFCFNVYQGNTFIDTPLVRYADKNYTEKNLFTDKKGSSNKQGLYRHRLAVFGDKPGLPEYYIKSTTEESEATSSFGGDNPRKSSIPSEEEDEQDEVYPLVSHYRRHSPATTR